MVQIKTIATASASELDTEVNKWIGRNRQYTILSINTFYRGDKVFNHCATIVYEVNVPDAKKH